jgi:hypothetical protein
VRLWGETVLIDSEAAVWCDGCGEFVEVSELARADNSHRVGLRPRRGALLPMGGERPDDPNSPPIADVQW